MLLDPETFRATLRLVGIALRVEVDVVAPDGTILVSGHELFAVTTREAPTTNPPPPHLFVNGVPYAGGFTRDHPFDCVALEPRPVLPSAAVVLAPQDEPEGAGSRRSRSTTTQAACASATRAPLLSPGTGTPARSRRRRPKCGAVEVCNRRDDDCDGTLALGEDRDGDGDAPVGAACVGGYPKDDCNDALPMVYAGAVELCNGLDTDCASGGGLVPAEDLDGDAHAPIGAACLGGYPRDDCDDALATVYLGAIEPCDRLDTDCREGGGAATAEDQDRDLHAPIGAACLGGYLRLSRRHPLRPRLRVCHAGEDAPARSARQNGARASDTSAWISRQLRRERVDFE